jgi:hypothetical protein
MMKKLISNMGRYGRPGASIKAFRDFFLKAHIFGADIDKKILFKDKRIITYFTDQSNINELQKLYKKIGNKFDLIIDDGLHSPYTNINVIISSIKYLKKKWMDRNRRYTLYSKTYLGGFKLYFKLKISLHFNSS